VIEQKDEREKGEREKVKGKKVKGKRGKKVTKKIDCLTTTNLFH